MQHAEVHLRKHCDCSKHVNCHRQTSQLRLTAVQITKRMHAIRSMIEFQTLTKWILSKRMNSDAGE